jgi:hypothetical protein
LAVSEGKEEMVACPNTHISAFVGGVNYNNPGFCTCTLYICNFLSMVKKEKIVIEKKKKRVPVPQKPPKTEEGKKTYNRKKEKVKLRKNQAVPPV